MSTPFLLEVEAAVRAISASSNTREAYLNDAKRWLAFCEEDGTDPKLVQEGKRRLVLKQDAAVCRWLDEMREQEDAAPKTRARRMSSLSSIDHCLRRRQKGAYNPFSPSEMKRERANRLEPTPIVAPEVAAKMFAWCAQESTVRGVPDALQRETLLRLLWSTGLRRASVASMTRSRLVLDGDDYLAEVDGKGGRAVHVLVRGRAAAALRLHMMDLLLDPARKNFKHVFLHAMRGGGHRPMLGHDVWEIVSEVAAAVGANGISPHSFRAAFITYGRAPLDARQDAAGHADSATTRLYDRHWRGREAFEKMPEAEDLVEEKR